MNDRVTPGPFTTVFLQGDGKILAYIEELPKTVAEGATMEEAKAALIAELALTLAANRSDPSQLRGCPGHLSRAVHRGKA